MRIVGGPFGGLPWDACGFKGDCCIEFHLGTVDLEFIGGWCPKAVFCPLCCFRSNVAHFLVHSQLLAFSS